MRRRAGLVLLLALVAGCSDDGGSPVAAGSRTATPTTPTMAPAASASVPPPATAGGEPDPSGSSASAQGTRTVSFHGARVTFPEGWHYRDSGPSACLDAARKDACSVVLYDQPASRRAGEETEDLDPEGAFGWYVGTDVPACADVDPAHHGAPGAALGDAPLLSSRISRRGFSPVGSKKAVYREFALSCQGTALGTARLWLLPTTRFAVVALDTYGTTPTAAVLRTVAALDTSGYRA
ncbi:MAG: hypothetical protein JWN17_1745 [Frankiales bacterium]|nr:hypothetical protein [Frankiales bacterium]